MYSFFEGLSPIYQALLAGMFTWSITTLGAAIVLFFKKVNKDIMDCLLAISAGIMLAASFFSLLAPSIEMAEGLGMRPYMVVCIGFLLGVLLLVLFNKIFTKLSVGKKSSGFRRCMLLVLSITLHNIPEGLVVGVAFGSILYNIDGATLVSALLLALGIGIQNFPEGSAVSLPLRREGLSRGKSFFIGLLSGSVEPISAVVGALLVMKVKFLLPYLLAFAAGAMIFVVVSELIPESQENSKKNMISMATIIGFIIMMFLDVALG